MPEPTLETSDTDLAERVRAGDERALSDLYDRHADRLYSLARSIVDDPASAEEAVTDAFLRLWREGDHDPSRGSVGAYLVVVTRSRALDAVRAGKRRGRAEQAGADASLQGAAVPISTPAESPERSVELSGARRRIVTALEKLTSKQREVIELAYFGGLTHREISERLSEPLGTVKTRLRDGMIRLREVFPMPGSTSEVDA